MSPQETVSQLKSWLNIEPAVGCPYCCAYCFRHDDGDFNLTIPQETFPPEVLFEALTQHPNFVPHETHLSISGTKSDAFLPQNKHRTFGLLDLLEENGFRNWVTMVTKGSIHPNDAERLASYGGIRPAVYVSYSDMPREVESVPNRQRIRSLQNLHRAGVQRVLYWRPIIGGVNDSNEHITKVLKTGEQYANAMVLSGIRISPEIEAYLELQGIQLPNEAWDPDHKLLPNGFIGRIMELHTQLGCTVPIFFKTSCSASYLEEQPDYNAHWSNPNKCSPLCPAEQQERCEAQSHNAFPIEVQALLASGNLSQETLTFYRQLYRLPT